MNVNYINFLLNFLKITILLSIVAVAVFIAQNSALINQPVMATAVTFDLMITLPVAYWLFIRKTKIAKQTVALFVVFGFVAASFALPENNRRFLDILQYYVLPLAEFGFLAYAGFLVFKARKTYKSLRENGRDFLETLRETLVKELPNEFLAKAAAFEFAAFYYAFLNWKTGRGENAFTYHKQNGTVALLIVFGFVIAVETFVLHILLAQWSVVMAWILTASSVYFLFQIFAHGKAVFLRPVEIVGNKLFVRCGLLGDAEIDLENIGSIERISAPSELKEDEVKLAPLGDFTACNVKIDLRDEAVLSGVYGRKKNFKTVFLSVDGAENFKERMIMANGGKRV